MRDLPDTVHAYTRTTTFSSAKIPPGLLSDHETKVGVWGVINLVSGSLKYHVPSRNESHLLRHALPLSAGEFVWIAIGQGSIEPDQLEHLCDLGPAFRARLTTIDDERLGD